MLLQDPLLQPLLVLVKREVPVLGLLLGQRIAVDSVVWIDEFIWREGSTTLLALVTISTRSMAAWTLTTDIAVREKLLCLWIVELLRGLLDKLAIIIEMTEEVRC